MPGQNRVRRVPSQVGFMMMMASTAHTVRDSNDPSTSKVHLFAAYTLGLLGLWLLVLSMNRPQAPAEALAPKAMFLSRVGFIIMMAASVAHTVGDSNDPFVSKVLIFVVYTLGVLGSGLLLLSMGRHPAPAEGAAPKAMFLSRVGFIMMTVASAAHTVGDSNDPFVSKVLIFAVYTLGVLGSGLLFLSIGHHQAPAEGAAPKAMFLSRVGFMMMVASAAAIVRDSNDPSVSKVYIFSIYSLGVVGSWLLLLSIGRP